MEKYSSYLDDNFSYSYGEEKLNLRNVNNSKFNCYYKKASYVPTSFKEECIRVCDKISDHCLKIGRIPTILFSGGLDSEIVIRAFLESGRPFKITTNRFLHSLNKHEIEWTEKISQQLSVKINYVDIDIANWLGSKESLDLAEISKCSYSEMLPTMKLIHDVWFYDNGLPVLGNGDFYACLSQGKWEYVEFEYIVAWMRYCIEKQITSAVNFFQLTPEIALSMALDPLIQDTVISKRYSNLRSTKYKVYKKYWRDIFIREKYDGSELIKPQCELINSRELYRYNEYTQRWQMPLNEFIEKLMPI
jgi:hypothetical protein